MNPYSLASLKNLSSPRYHIASY